MKSVAFAALITSVDAHGSLVLPPARNNYGLQNPLNISDPPRDDHHGGMGGGTYEARLYGAGGGCPGDSCMWWNQGCFIGCAECTNKMPKKGNRFGEPNCNASTGLLEPTLPDEFRTWNLGNGVINPSTFGDYTKHHPWRRPGTAPTTDVCGMAGGYDTFQEEDPIPLGANIQDRGSDLPPTGIKTEWVAGGTTEVGWMMNVNHGGGYLYQLCPKDEELTEECFQAHILEYATGDHIIRYLDTLEEIVIPAHDLSEGTHPAGSTWRKNPVPACNCDRGTCQVPGDHDEEQDPYFNGTYPTPHYANHSIDNGHDGPVSFDCNHGTMFEVKFPYGYGFVQHMNDPGSPERNFWVIVDEVRVPEKVGEYVLRWRWDCEQGPQVWTHCSDINIVSGDVVA